MNDEVVDAEFLVVELPAKDPMGEFVWRTREGELIRVVDMQDKHLRNCAMFLMGLGYVKCLTPEPIRIAWLTVFRTEWERRMARRNNEKIWRVR